MCKKQSPLSYYLDMWKRGLDFKGLSSIRAYRSALLLHTLVILLLTAISWFYPEGKVAVNTLAAYGILSLVPFLALSVRRFHDAGKSGWWTILVFLGVGIIFCICWGIGTLSAIYSSYSVVYGPPPVE